MLYDQSQLARVYLHAWQVTGNEFFRTITEEILESCGKCSILKGGVYSTQDADSEGEERKLFVWTGGEIRRVLAEEAETNQRWRALSCEAQACYNLVVFPFIRFYKA